ncbi:P-loop NTPase [Streptomyces fructofermentans]|uniref:P-loop NTPase n=1 Tax=Streptomyces fructofermentans TaxID=152141 RepID=UPI00379306C7
MWQAAVMGVASGALAGIGALWWERRQTAEQRRAAWESAVTSGPAGQSVLDEAAAADSVLAALNPDREVVPFSPLRGTDATAAVQWCDGAGDLRVWRIAGEAGNGKTRLLLEVQHRVEDRGWRCGWVRRGHAADAVTAAALQKEPVLLLVDDADALPDHQDLAAMLTAVARTEGDARLRVVLAARDFGGWWGQLREGLDPAVDARLRPPGRTRLTAWGTTTTDQHQLFEAALRHYARHCNLAPPAITLTGITVATPVAELHAAAASAVHHGLTGSVPISTALQRLFTTEEDWWQTNASHWDIPYPLPVLQAVITAATLIGADDRAQFSRRLQCLPGLTTAPARSRDDLALWVHQLYAQRGGEWLDPHLPARLTERYAVACAASQPALPAALAAAALTA